MGQVAATEKASATITAFTHWVMQDTACQFCFSDIQGTRLLVFHRCHANANATGTKYEDEKGQGYILFDPMAHSTHG
jgi:hypothetical protein